MEYERVLGSAHTSPLVVANTFVTIAEDTEPALMRRCNSAPVLPSDAMLAENDTAAHDAWLQRIVVALPAKEELKFETQALPDFDSKEQRSAGVQYIIARNRRRAEGRATWGYVLMQLVFMQAEKIYHTVRKIETFVCMIYSSREFVALVYGTDRVQHYQLNITADALADLLPQGFYVSNGKNGRWRHYQPCMDYKKVKWISMCDYVPKLHISRTGRLILGPGICPFPRVYTV